MAAPDGLMDLIPVTEQSGIYGRPQFTYRGVFDPLDFGFNDNKALQSAWRAALSYVTGAHNLKVGYQGYFSAVHNGRVPNHTQLRYTFNNQVPISVSYFLAPRWDQHDRTRDVRDVRPGPVDGRAADAAGRRAVRPRVELGAGRRQRRHGHVALQPAADFVRRKRSASAATTTSRRASGSPTTSSATARRRSRSTSAGISRRPRPTSSTAPTTRRRASSRASGRGRRAARGWTDGNGNYAVDCDLLNPAAPEQPGHRRGPVRGRRRRRPEFRQRQPQHHDHQSRDSRRLGSPSVRLAVRRLRAARAAAAAVGRGRLHPALVGELLRDRQRADDGGGLRHLRHRHSAAREPAGRRRARRRLSRSRRRRPRGAPRTT